MPVRLCDDLTKHFGSQTVFMDVAHINPGDDFVGVLTDAVGSCDVLIALIGRRWLTSTDTAGQRRLESPADYVRLEFMTALDRNIRVFLVLVEGVAMLIHTRPKQILK